VSEGVSVPIGTIAALIVLGMHDVIGEDVEGVYIRALDTIDETVCDARWFVLCPKEIAEGWGLLETVADALSGDAGTQDYRGEVVWHGTTYCFSIVVC
jgi:hypothetical protein